MLRVAGLTPLTTIDYPGELAAVVFCQGCPWRCRYCHNADLQSVDGLARFTWEEIRDFLAKRRGLLDAVVFSGGEPIAQGGLAAALAEVQSLGLKVGLHTSGCYPERLAAVVPWLDWVGLDIKALPDRYPAVTGVPGSGERAWESLRRLLMSDVALEVRTTLMPDWRFAEDIRPLMERLAAAGVTRYVLQAMQGRLAAEPALMAAGPVGPPPQALAFGNAHFDSFQVRPDWAAATLKDRATKA